MISQLTEQNSDCNIILDKERILAKDFDLGELDTPIANVVVFLPCSFQEEHRSALKSLTSRIGHSSPCHVILVGSYRSHFEDQGRLAMESTATELFQTTTDSRLTILRAGHLLGTEGTLTKRLRRYSFLYPLATKRWKSCFVHVDELLETIQDLTKRRPRSPQRILTLLGPNRLMQEVLQEHQTGGAAASGLSIVCRLLSLLQIGHLASALFRLRARFSRPMQRWQCDTIEPHDVSELLALYNPYNYKHVAIAGYNTGVVHFGWKFPNQTVVKTIQTGRCIRVRDNNLKVDAGIILKHANEKLRKAEREFYVMPNYSYISMGTTFIVPIHGSGSDVSTLGDTIEEALLYDPLTDDFLRVKRGDSLFGEAMYKGDSGLLALRLKFRVRPKSSYFVRREILESPTAKQIWDVFLDEEASNIEIRKSRAGDDSIEVSKYYTSSEQSEDLLEVPKDSLGRLWDRLEENPITSYLFHTIIRSIGYHVELFMDEDQFPTFWESHHKLPLSKIQLRYVRSDGLSNSPFGERDCISADIFMKKKDSAEFLAFMKEHLPDVKYNPGKHSM